ncbi:axoneme-associated protein mst101(3)-like [Dysidea avara]|uniref:axoneme-associated protein mst101(3)-like n=1 Tax=Dysidea avara TaxID=196820 RepID=UPI003329C1BB
MSPPPDNTLTEMQDVVSPVEDHPPEQHVRPPGEQSVVQGAATQSKSAVVCTPPEHEGELKYISKYLVQYVPVKAKKPPTSGRVTGARILTSEECAQLIFEHEEKKKKEKEEKEARKAAREQKKKEKEEAARKKTELAEKRREEAAKRKEEAAKKREETAKRKEAAKKKEEATKRKEEAARKKAEQIFQSHKRRNSTVGEGT